MATDVEICNMALDVVSVTNKITTLNSAGTKEERVAARWFATTRDAVLRLYPWPFTKKTKTLVAIPAATETNLEWPYLYDVPTDWLKSRRVFVEGQVRNRTPRIPFNTFLNEGLTKYIVGADTSGLSLEYTRKFPDNAALAFLPATFVNALSIMLAVKFVKPLSLDADLVQEGKELFKEAVAEAFADNLEEVQFDEPPDAEWITARE